jgi:hypothetical protein
MSQELDTAVAAQQQVRRPSTVRVRAVLLGIALIPIQGFISLYGFLFPQSHPATVSLYFNAVITLLVLVVANAGIGRLRPRWALSPAELSVIYVMQALATALYDHDQMHNLVPVVAYPVWHATQDNGWMDLFGQYLKPWVTPLDRRVLWVYYDSHLPLLATPHWRGWIMPALSWSLFMFLMCWVMLCLNALFRRNWADESKLSFPIVQLPLEMVSRRGELYRSKLMWIGFLIAMAIDILNGLHHLYPQVPSFLGARSAAYDLGQQVKNMPWRAIGWTPLNVFPFAVGLAFFIPLDLAFSCWFFYVYWKWVRIGSAAAGWGRIPRSPWVDEQSFGAYMALAFYSLWSGRNALMAGWQALFGRRASHDNEPLPYHVAMIGALIGFSAITVFLMGVGASFVGATSWLLIYLAISLAVARIRAELGSPVHDLHFMGPEVALVQAFSAKSLGKPTLVTYSFLYAFTRAHRSHPMPVQIEAMKLASETNLSQRWLSFVLVLTCMVCLPIGWFMMLDGSARFGNMPSYPGRESFLRLESWLRSGAPASVYSVAAMGVGLATTVALAAMRSRFTWWLFHPAGYAVSGSWSMALFAPSVFVSWLAKTAILRYGGMTSYRPASRFFAGLILGEFATGTFWVTYGIIKHKPMYNFLP